MLRKKQRKTERMDFYTLSKSEQQTPGRTAEESGSGNWYNSNFDKLHNVAVTSSYNLNSSFALQTGPTSFPNGQYEYLELIK
jgi:hypothetical protein